MREVQERGERSPGTARGAEVGGKGDTKERDELVPFPLPQETFSRAGSERERPGWGGAQRKNLVPLLWDREEAGVWGHLERLQSCETHWGNRKGRREQRLGLELFNTHVLPSEKPSR